MMKTFELGEQPTVMTAIAQAVWNQERGYWEVSIVQSETGHTYPDKTYTFTQRTDKVKVRDCDEAVIAHALLYANGVLPAQEWVNCIVSGES